MHSHIPMRDVDDALAYSLALRDVLVEYEREHPGSVRDERSPHPDPNHPGVATASWLRHTGWSHRMEGGTVRFGERDCSRCGQTFYMEQAIDRNGKTLDTLGGVIFADGLVLCDECSPI